MSPTCRVFAFLVLLPKGKFTLANLVLFTTALYSSALVNKY